MGLFPKSRARIRREASTWVVRLAEHASADDQAAFRQWRDSDPRHSEAYDRITNIWNQAGRLSPVPAAFDARANLRPERPGAFRFVLAASLAAVALVSAILLGSRWLTGPGAQQETIMLASAPEGTREIQLSDGSRLILDSASKLELVFTKAERRLTLRSGRARFQVAHDARPFAVRAGTSEIVATGTLFDVSLIAGRTTVLLLEGSVEVRAIASPRADGPRPERLLPGQKLILAGSAPPERQHANEADRDWPGRMLEFDNTRLDEAAALANRYSGAQLKLDNERIRGLRVSGAFRAGDAAGFARGLAEAFKLRVVVQPDGNLLLADADPAVRPTRL